MRKTHSTPEKVEAWLLKQIIQGAYTINADLSVDIKGSITIQTKNKYLPVNFSSVSDSLTLMEMPLVSLEGCPLKPVSNFLVAHTLIEDLTFAPPATISFSTQSNSHLTSLKGSPQEITTFICADCSNLTSLKLGPQTVHKDYSVMRNHIQSLEGIAKHIGRNLTLNNNAISCFDFEPDFVGGRIDIRHNPIQEIMALPQKTQFSKDMLCNTSFPQLSAYNDLSGYCIFSQEQLRAVQEKILLEQQLSADTSLMFLDKNLSQEDKVSYKNRHKI